MKDYLEKTGYTDTQKKVIMDLAKHLYCRFGIGSVGRGWNVCDECERETSVIMAMSIYTEFLEPYIIKQANLMKKRVKSNIINIIRLSNESI